MANKRRFRTWKEAEDAERAAGIQSSIAQEALNYAATCHINWLKDGSYEVALINAGRAHGGIVLVRYQKFVSAHSAPLWADEGMRLTGWTADENSIRSLAFKVKEMMQRVAGAIRLTTEMKVIIQKGTLTNPDGSTKPVQVKTTMTVQSDGKTKLRHVIDGKDCEGKCQ